MCEIRYLFLLGQSYRYLGSCCTDIVIKKSSYFVFSYLPALLFESHSFGDMRWNLSIVLERPDAQVRASVIMDSVTFALPTSRRKPFMGSAVCTTRPVSPPEHSMVVRIQFFFFCLLFSSSLPDGPWRINIISVLAKSNRAEYMMARTQNAEGIKAAS
ncbi:hypothetical protein VTN96DRAFT_6219 [Rasamsonia emersonii]